MSREYRKLQVFGLSDELALEIYRLTTDFPKSEMFGVTSQLRRAALSVPTNIVEGSYRDSTKEYLRFLEIAYSSMAEVGYLVEFSLKLGYISEPNASNFLVKHDLCIRKLKSLINSYSPVPPQPQAPSREPPHVP